MTTNTVTIYVYIYIYIYNWETRKSISIFHYKFISCYWWILEMNTSDILLCINLFLYIYVYNKLYIEHSIWIILFKYIYRIYWYNIITTIYIYIYIYICKQDVELNYLCGLICQKTGVGSLTHFMLCKLATIVEGDLKTPCSIAPTPRCRVGHYSFPWISLLYHWSVPYNAEC